MRRSYRIVENFRPSILNEDYLRKEFSQILIRQGLRCCETHMIEVRNPEENLKVFQEFVQEAAIGESPDRWHLDGPSESPRYFSIIWSNEFPTEMRDFYTKQPFYCQAGDIVLMDNDLVEHRIPGFIGNNRWFIRTMLENLKRYNCDWRDLPHPYETHRMMAERALNW